MVFWICQKWSFHWWSLKLLSQITDLKHFKQNWLNNFRLHQGKDRFWQIEKTMHQFCSVQLYPELTNQAETNQNIPQKLWRRVEKSGFWRFIILQLLSLYESGTRGRLRLCRGATVARLTPDQKVACSNHVGLTLFSSNSTFWCMKWKKKNRPWVGLNHQPFG